MTIEFQIAYILDELRCSDAVDLITELDQKLGEEQMP